MTKTQATIFCLLQKLFSYQYDKHERPIITKERTNLLKKISGSENSYKKKTEENATFSQN